MSFLHLVLILLPVGLTVSQDITLSIVHVNDFHARFDVTNNQGGECSQIPCIGGFSRLYKQITDNLVTKNNTQAILLNAGDNFQGTLWYNMFKWNVTQYFLNKLPWDAIVLGNHEFDDGIAGVVPFIKSLRAPVVVSNIDDSLEPDIRGTYQKSVVIQRNGRKIGIIGVIIKTTDQISSSGKLKFYDESASVNAEAERLVREQNVFTNIVLSHSGYDLEQAIGRKATAQSKISLIVGGHSHTFLYTGEPVPGPLKPAGPYPTIVNRTDGQPVLVVQASCYNRYLGKIDVTFDGSGRVIGHRGDPVFLDSTLPQDANMTRELTPWKEGVDTLGKRVIGRSLVNLDQTGCRTGECLLGNFVTDSMVYGYSQSSPTSWTTAALAIMNAGGLRTSIPNGNVTYSDMMIAQPFGNTFDVGEIQGKFIWEMFEFSMTPYFFGRAMIDANLLQVSGFQVTFDITKPVGSRVVSVKVRCADCTIPKYENLDLGKTYRLIVPSFLTTGGDGFKVLHDNLKNVKVGRLDIDVFVEYFQHRSPVYEEVDGRINIVGEHQIRVRNLGSEIRVDHI